MGSTPVLPYSHEKKHVYFRQAIRLAELLRHELGLVISPREILGSPDVAALVQGLQAQGQQERMKWECGWSSWK